MKGKIIGIRECKDGNTGNTFGYFITIGREITEHGTGLSASSVFVSNRVISECNPKPSLGDICFMDTQKTDKGGYKATDIIILE